MQFVSWRNIPIAFSDPERPILNDYAAVDSLTIAEG